MEKSFEFSNLFSREGQAFGSRKEIIERSNKMRDFDEEYHTKGRPEWIINLYLELDHFITNLKSQVRKEYLETYIKYSYNGLLFVYILIRKGENLRIWAKVSYSDLGSAPLFVRDYEPVMHRAGVMIIFGDQREFVRNKEAMLDVTFGIIKKALQGIAGRKIRKTPLKPVMEVESVKPVEVVRPSSINILAGENGYLNINLKIHKSQKEILDRILQDTIFK